MIRSMMVLGAAVLMGACATTVGSRDPGAIAEDATEICEAQCEALGLELDALAVAKRDVGCICEPED